MGFGYVSSRIICGDCSYLWWGLSWNVAMLKNIPVWAFHYVGAIMNYELLVCCSLKKYINTRLNLVDKELLIFKNI